MWRLFSFLRYLAHLDAMTSSQLDALAFKGKWDEEGFDDPTPEECLRAMQLSKQENRR